MGHGSVPHPRPGGGAGDFTPAQAKKFFEFFPRGSSFEVLLLGHLHAQRVHWVKSKGHKVLCSLDAEAGGCHLCQVAAASDDVGTRQVEYLAPAFVRPRKQKQFDQRVAVFTAAAGEEVVGLLAAAGLAERGQVVEVESVPNNKGKGHRYRVKLLPGLAPALAAALPPAFDVAPFVRARFGRPQVPGEPLVFLAPFREVPRAGAFALPQPLRLKATDYEPPTDEDREKARQLLRAHRDRTAAADAAESPAPTSPPTSPAAAEPPAPQQPPAARPPAGQPDDPGELRGAIDGVVARLAPALLISDGVVTIEGDADRSLFGRPLQRGPRVAVYQPPTPEDEEAALTQPTGSIICGEYRDKPFLKRAKAGCLTGNGSAAAKPAADAQPSANGKGGAK